jgi:hypothetical protein
VDPGWRPAAHEHDGEYWLLFGVCYLPFYLALLRRTCSSSETRCDRQAFLVLLLLSYWAQHALLWGDTRYNLALYPVLVAMALPIDKLETSRLLKKVQVQGARRSGE